MASYVKLSYTSSLSRSYGCPSAPIYIHTDIYSTPPPSTPMLLVHSWHEELERERKTRIKCIDIVHIVENVLPRRCWLKRTEERVKCKKTRCCPFASPVSVTASMHVIVRYVVSISRHQLSMLLVHWPDTSIGLSINVKTTQSIAQQCIIQQYDPQAHLHRHVYLSTVSACHVDEVIIGRFIESKNVPIHAS